MASEGGGKIKAKRSYAASKPYEKRKSLLGKVKETVKDLLAPSWLTDFMSTVSRKNSSTEIEDNAPLIEDDEDVSPFRPTIQSNSIVASTSSERPPPLPINKFHPASNTTRSVPSPFSSSQLQFSQLASRHRGDQALYGKPERTASKLPHLDRSQPDVLKLNETELQKLRENIHLPTASTSERQSSRVPAVETRLTDVPASTRTSSQDTVSGQRQHNKDEMSGLVHQPKIWSTQSGRKGKHLNPAVKERPSFNTLLFGTPLNTSILGEAIHESSFYSGRTAYGGASAHRKPRLNVTAPYQNVLPLRKTVKPKMHNSSFTSGAITSSTSQRILETLERMSTPLSDAKKIPSNESSMADSVLSFTPGSYRRQSRRISLPSTSLPQRSMESSSRAPPTSQLRTPSIASIAKNRQSLSSTPLSSRFPQNQEVTYKATEISLSQVKEKPEIRFTRTDTMSLDELPGSGGFGGKIKRDKSYRHRAPKLQDDDEVIEVPNLQTDVTLKVGSMPKFEFSTSPITSPAVKSSAVNTPAMNTEKKSAQINSALKTSLANPKGKSLSVGGSSKSTTAEDTHSNIKFTFSTPIVKPHPEQNVDNSRQKLGFKFSSPLKIDEKDTPEDKKTFGITSEKRSSENFSFGSSSKRKSAMGNGGFGIAVELKEGSVMDILGKGNLSSNVFKSANELKNNSIVDNLPAFGVKPLDKKTGDKTESVSDMFKPASMLKTGSVMDVLGKTSSVQPRSDGSKPVAQLKEGSVMDVLSKDDKSTVNLLAKFKNAPGSWECDTCMIQNKSDVDKCVACQSKKKPSDLPKLIPQTDPLAKFAKPAGAWECNVCMVQNKADAVKCVACTSAKPGAKSASSGGLGNTSTGQGNKDSVFKKPTGSWDCDTCMVQNKAQSKKCVACEMPRPGSKPSGAFSSSGGFKIGSSIGSISEGGGFKIGNNNAIPSSLSFGVSKSDTISKVGEMEKTDTNTSESSVVGSSNVGTVSGGFKFGNANDILKKPTQEIGQKSVGFIFGGPESKTSSDMKQVYNFGGADTKTSGSGGVSTTEQSEPKPGGFSLSSTVSQTSKESEKKHGGFSFGNNMTQTSKEVKHGGISFGTPVSQTSKPSDSVPGGSVPGGFSLGSATDNMESAKSTPVTLQGGFSFGSNTNAISDSMKNTSAEKGGFSFGSAGSGNVEVTNSAIFIKDTSNVSGNVSSVESTKSSGTSIQSARETKTENVQESSQMFDFSNANKGDNSSQSNSTFSFGQQVSSTDPLAPKPMFSAPKSTEVRGEMVKPNASLFTFGQPVTNKLDSIAGQSAASGFSGPPSSKRRTNEEAGASEAKKSSFSFGAHVSAGAGAFNFGGTAASTNGPSTPFVFGAGSNGPTDLKAAASTGGAFGSFSQQSSAAVPATTSASASLFQFGSTPSSVQFGNPGSTAAFGNGQTGSGALAFGASTPLATPTTPFGNTSNAVPSASAAVFGSSVPAFGSTSATSPASFAAPSQGVAFGATAGFGSTSQQNTSGFNFNAATTNFGGNKSGSLFQFSGTNSSEIPAGAAVQSSASTGFSFTAQPLTGAPAPAFNPPQQNFSTGTSGAFNFGTHSEPGGGPQRKMKRAVRKLKK